jgi:hypothetical protein
MELVSTEYIVEVDGMHYARVDGNWFRTDGDLCVAVNALLMMELERQFQCVIGDQQLSQAVQRQ